MRANLLIGFSDFTEHTKINLVYKILKSIDRNMLQLYNELFQISDLKLIFLSNKTKYIEHKF